MGGPPPGASAALARSLVPELVRAGVEAPIAVDQTNHSVVVDDAVVVKWLLHPPRHPHRGLRLLEHLREVGFSAMPPFHGARVEGDLVVATVTGYLPRVRDGWEWYTDAVSAWIDGHSSWEELERVAREVGVLAGRLHVALATPSGVLPEPVTAVPVRPLHERAMHLLAEAKRVTDGPAGHRLADRAERIATAIAPLAAERTTPAISLHGDLHVGNILRGSAALVVTDFDGDPLGGAGSVLTPAPAAIDVAALLQSIDHVGRVVDRRRAGADHEAVTSFIERSLAAAAAAYTDALARHGRSQLLDVDLLAPLQVAQELHELVYAARHIPHWVYVPDGALAHLFPDPAPDRSATC